MSTCVRNCSGRVLFRHDCAAPSHARGWPLLDGQATRVVAAHAREPGKAIPLRELLKPLLTPQ